VGSVNQTEVTMFPSLFCCKETQNPPALIDFVGRSRGDTRSYKHN